MIPRTIHYCWFGNGARPKLIERCVASWRQFAPDFELREWNESTFDVAAFPFARDAYAAGNYAFVSDIARAMALYEHGGVYLDTDVELLAPLDSFLVDRCFLGFEAGEYVGTAIIGAEPGHPLWKEFLDRYREMEFHDFESSSVQILTALLVSRGLRREDTLQRLESVAIYPSTVFSPLDYRSGKLAVTPQSVAIHHYSGSWLPWRARLGMKTKRFVRRWI